MKRLHAPNFDSPRLTVIWAAIAALQPDEALEVAIALHRMLGRGSFPSTRQKDRKADALACLRQVAEMLGRSPSVRDYETARKNHPDLELIASGSIRTRLGGGWNDCLKRAQLEIVPDGDLPVSKRTDFTEEALITALKECHRDLGEIPTQYTYREWAQRPDVLARPGNRPQTYSPMLRVFGGFPAALRAAGIVDDVIVRRGRVDPVEWSYEERELLDALRAAHARLGFSPSVQEYSDERRKLMAEQMSDGLLTHPLPGAGAIRRRFRTWSGALEKAGLPPRRLRRGPKPGPKEPRYSDTVLFQRMREAYAEFGEPFTYDAYAAWRQQRLSADPTKGIPSAWTIVHRFRSWGGAVERAFDESTDPTDDEGQGADAADA